MAGRKVFWASVLLVVLTCLAYGRVLTGGAGYIWDDDAHVKANGALRDGQGLVDMWAWGPRAVFRKDQAAATPQYYPVTFTSFWLEYQMWGLRATGYHVTNVTLHLLSAFLIWIILRKLGVGGSAGWVAWFAAALFAVHPVNVESVAWISERKNTLSLALYLLAALCWIVWDGLDVPAGSERKRSGQWLFWAIFLFVLALLAKSVTVTLPAALLIVVWWKRGRVGMKEWKGLLPLFGIGMLSGALTAFIETNANYIGATGQYFPSSFGERCVIAGRAVWFYLESLVAPVRLMFFYPRWQLHPHAAIAWVAPAGVLAALVVLFAMRKIIGRGPVVIGLLFVASLGPALGFINFYPMQFSLVADHFQYVAMIPVCVGVAAALWSIGRGAQGTTQRVFIPAVGMMVLVALASLSFVQTRMYRDEITLYRETLAVNPGAWVASQNLAELLAEQDRTKNADEVMALFRRALEQHPGDGRMLSGMGATMLVLQNFPESQKAYEQAVAMMPENVPAHAGLGNALLLQGKYDEALEQYDIASARLPGNAEFIAAGGNALLHANQPAAAERKFRAAIAIQDGWSYEYFLGMSLRDQGRVGAAMDAFRASIQLNAQHPESFLELAELLAKLHQDDKAIAAFQAALHVQKDFMQAQLDLGRLLMITEMPGKSDPVWAADLFRQVLDETHGAQPGIRIELATALAAAKYYDEAAEALREFLRETAGASLSPEAHELVLQQLQKYELIGRPSAARDSTGGAPISGDQKHVEFDSYPDPPEPQTGLDLHLIPPP
jgi:protein O-mannosyl-transferase